MNICPICKKPYIKSKPTKFGGMEYIHQVKETFSEVCTQSSASYEAAQPRVQRIGFLGADEECPHCHGIGWHLSTCQSANR